MYRIYTTITKYRVGAGATIYVVIAVTASKRVITSTAP